MKKAPGAELAGGKIQLTKNGIGDNVKLLMAEEK